MQTFFLAVQEKGYFVLNDIFRYLPELPAQSTAAPAAPSTIAAHAPIENGYSPRPLAAPAHHPYAQAELSRCLAIMSVSTHGFCMYAMPCAKLPLQWMEGRISALGCTLHAALTPRMSCCVIFLVAFEAFAMHAAESGSPPA